MTAICLGLVINVVLCLGSLNGADDRAIDASALVRRAVQKETSAVETDTDYWRYRLRKETASGSQVKDMVETKNGIVARLIAVNDQPLTVEQRTLDDQRLAKLIADPEEQRKKQREQVDEANRVLSLIRALPDALLYQYVGKENVNGRETIRLKFTPNPKFSPTTRETYVYKGAGGFLLIDAAAGHISRKMLQHYTAISEQAKRLAVESAFAPRRARAPEKWQYAKSTG